MSRLRAWRVGSDDEETISAVEDPRPGATEADAAAAVPPRAREYGARGDPVQEPGVLFPHARGPPSPAGPPTRTSLHVRSDTLRLSAHAESCVAVPPSTRNGGPR